MKEDALAFFEWGALVTNVHHRLGSLLTCYRISQGTINQISQVDWYDPSADHSANKQAMKTLGGALFSYRHFLTEMMVIGIAKSNEDLFVDIKDVFSTKFDIWRTTLDLRFLDEMRCLRHLSNVVKHSQGVIVDNQSRSHRSLIDVYGYQPNCQVVDLPIHLPTKIAEAYAFQMDLLEKETGFPGEVSGQTGPEILTTIEPWLSPNVLKLQDR